MMVQLPPRFKDRPSDAFIPFVQNNLQLVKNIVTVRHAMLGGFLHHIIHGLEQKLFGKHHVRPEGQSPFTLRPGTDGRKALIGCTHPCVQGADSRLLAVVLEERRAGRWLESEIVDSLPVAGDNAGRGVKVREYAGVSATLEKECLGPHFRELRDVLQSLGEKVSE